MVTVYIVFFGIGIGLVLISLIFGDVFGFDGLELGDDSLVPLKPSIIACFIVVFGGTGLALSRYVDWYVSLPIAGLLGVFVAYVLYRYVITPLMKSEVTVLETQSLIGHEAKVTLKIPQGKYGKITYVVDDRTFTAPAKSADGGEIGAGRTVEIMYIEKTTYFVKEI